MKRITNDDAGEGELSPIQTQDGSADCIGTDGNNDRRKRSLYSRRVCASRQLKDKVKTCVDHSRGVEVRTTALKDDAVNVP